jgi:hypothetical protein
MLVWRAVRAGAAQGGHALPTEREGYHGYDQYAPAPARAATQPHHDTAAIVHARPNGPSCGTCRPPSPGGPGSRPEARRASVGSTKQAPTTLPSRRWARHSSQRAEGVSFQVEVTSVYNRESRRCAPTPALGCSTAFANGAACANGGCATRPRVLEATISRRVLATALLRRSGSQEGAPANRENRRDSVEAPSIVSLGSRRRESSATVWPLRCIRA